MIWMWYDLDRETIVIVGENPYFRGTFGLNLAQQFEDAPERHGNIRESGGF